MQLSMQTSACFTCYVTTLKEEHLQSSPCMGPKYHSSEIILVDHGNCKAAVDVAVQLCSPVGQTMEWGVGGVGNCLVQ